MNKLFWYIDWWIVCIYLLEAVNNALLYTKIVLYNEPTTKLAILIATTNGWQHQRYLTCVIIRYTPITETRKKSSCIFRNDVLGNDILAIEERVEQFGPKLDKIRSIMSSCFYSPDNSLVWVIPYCPLSVQAIRGTCTRFPELWRQYVFLVNRSFQSLIFG